jgi:peptidoglycan/LPS O-acetylase OafA/YrhL
MSENDHIKRYAYIDALRGYAILMVIAVHSSQFFTDLPNAVKTLADQGARGVQLFFVASALTLSLSWQARNDGAIAFYVRRFFRIAPMFWLAIVFFVALQGLGPRYYAPDGIGARHIALAALFLHGLMPDTITSVVPGSWSIADEMMFYSIFPLLFLAFSRVRLGYAVALTAAATSLCIVINTRANLSVVGLPEPDHRLWQTFFFLWLPQQLPCFLFGMLLYKISLARKLPSQRAAIFFVLSGMAMAAISFMNNETFISRLGLRGMGLAYLGLPTTIFGMVFFFFAFCLMNWQPRLLVNPVIGWIGKVSYSAYFIHFALIETVPMPSHLSGNSTLNYLIVFAALSACTIAVSSITYRLIEQPAIALGNRILRRSRRGQVSVDPGADEATREQHVPQRLNDARTSSGIVAAQVAR